MAYAKLPKVIPNYGLGFQTINQAKDNEEDYRFYFESGHVLSDATPGGLGNFRPNGRHDFIPVPRGVVSVKTQTLGVANGTATSLTYLDLASSIYVRGVGRTATGVYFVFTQYTGDDSFADVQAKSTGTSVVRLAKSTYQAASSSQADTGFVVNLYELSAGAFVAADFDFTLSAFSR